VRIQRRARRLRILGDQLEVTERGHHGDQKGHQERKPRRSPDLSRDVTRQCVDTGAEDVADDEQQQQPWAHHPLEFGCFSTVVTSVMAAP